MTSVNAGTPPHLSAPVVVARTLTAHVAVAAAEPLATSSTLRAGVVYRADPVEVRVTWWWLDDPADRQLRSVHVLAWPINAAGNRFGIGDEPSHYAFYPSDLAAAPRWLRDVVKATGQLCENTPSN